MQITAIYPGVFDPITRAHVDLIQRASRLFRVVVAVSATTSKSPLFSHTKRLALAKEALASLENVEVQGFQGLLVRHANSSGAQVILRGVRGISDLDYEFRMASANRQLYPNLETLFLRPSECYNHLSSSLVREVALLGGDVSAFVPENVLTALRVHVENLSV
ncbi:Phosphopantetheine adenylyltransferase [Gammaproteobacteria bacterium]